MQRKVVILMFVLVFLFSLSSVTCVDVIKLKLANSSADAYELGNAGQVL